MHSDLQETSDESESESESDEESDAEWQPKKEKRTIKTPASKRRRVRFANEAEIPISIDTSIEEERDEQDTEEARS